MAYGFVELSAGLLALQAADQPILLGENLLQDGGALGNTAVGEWSSDGILGGAGIVTDANFPVRYGHDRRLDIVTVHVAPALGDAYLIYDLGVGNEISFDCAVLSGHNQSGVTTTIDLMVSNTGDFVGGGGSPVVIAQFVDPTTSARLVSSSLDHLGASSRLYSNVQFVAVRFNPAATSIHELGQLWLAQRLQLEHQFKYPHPFKQRRTKRKTFRSDDDHATQIILADQAEVLPAVKTQITDTAVQPTLIQDVQDFLDAVSWGGKPFHYLEQPTTLSQSAPLMNWKSDPKYLEIEAGVQALQVDAVEEAPLAVSET